MGDSYLQLKRAPPWRRDRNGSSPIDTLAYNLANFLRTLALPETVKQWSLTTLRNRLVKIGARIVLHGRSVIFQMAEGAVPRALLQQILDAIAALRPLPPARC
jgi:hypothetical protein